MSLGFLTIISIRWLLFSVSSGEIGVHSGETRRKVGLWRTAWILVLTRPRRGLFQYCCVVCGHSWLLCRMEEEDVPLPFSFHALTASIMLMPEDILSLRKRL